jgi:hypothetical protein
MLVVEQFGASFTLRRYSNFAECVLNCLPVTAFRNETMEVANFFSNHPPIPVPLCDIFASSASSNLGHQVMQEDFGTILGVEVGHESSTVFLLGAKGLYSCTNRLFNAAGDGRYPGITWRFN